MDFLQQVGFVSITTSGLVTSLTSGGVPVAVRVFDLAMGVTGAAASVVLWTADASGTTTGQLPVIALANAQLYLHTDVGYRFPNGCYCWLSGTTATVNYIIETR